MKVMAAQDVSSLPVAAQAESASPHEVTLVEATINNCFLDRLPERLIGDKFFDGDSLHCTRQMV